MLSPFSSSLALGILQLPVYHEETQEIMTNWKKPSARGWKILIYLWRNRFSCLAHPENHLDE